VKEGVTVNGDVVKKAVRTKEKDAVTIDMDRLRQILEQVNVNKGLGSVEPQEGKLEIVEESRDWIVLNKPKGLVVHPGTGNPSGTLANFVAGYLSAKGEYDPSVKRGGVVHRLDKGVSGLIIFAKNRSSQLYLKKQFETRKVTKMYIANARKVRDTEFSALVSGLSSFEPRDTAVERYLRAKRVDSSWTKVEGRIARDSSNRMRMRFTTSGRSGRYSCLYIKPLSPSNFLILLKTGRMHQIRATLGYLGFVIQGDTLYGDFEQEFSSGIELQSVVLGLREMGGEMKVWKLI
jgi:23S rRNA pseudouridine1911/1915/1917 synthase